MPRWYRIFLLHVLRAGPTQERVKRSAPEWEKRTSRTSVPISFHHGPSKHESLRKYETVQYFCHWVHMYRIYKWDNLNASTRVHELAIGTIRIFCQLHAARRWEKVVGSYWLGKGALWASWPAANIVKAPATNFLTSE
jgi:hypothetical protein